MLEKAPPFSACVQYVCVCVQREGEVWIPLELGFDINPDKNTHLSFHCSVILSDAVWLKKYKYTLADMHKQSRLHRWQHASWWSIQRRGINLKLCFCLFQSSLEETLRRGSFMYSCMWHTCNGESLERCSSCGGFTICRTDMIVQP